MPVPTNEVAGVASRGAKVDSSSCSHGLMPGNPWVLRIASSTLRTSLGCGTVVNVTSNLHTAEKLLAGMSRAEKAQVLQWASQDVGESWAGIESHPEVCGGEACVVRTRIPVWLLEQARRLGVKEVELLRSYPTLSALDLSNVWGYVRAHRQEIAEAIAANESEEV